MSVQLWNFQARFSVTRLVHERILGMLADFPEVMLIQNWKKFDQYSTHSELYYTKSMEINIFTRTFLRSKSDCIYWQIVTKIFIKDLHRLVAASYIIGTYLYSLELGKKRYLLKFKSCWISAVNLIYQPQWKSSNQERLLNCTTNCTIWLFSGVNIVSCTLVPA